MFERFVRGIAVTIGVFGTLVAVAVAQTATIDECRQLLRTGQYVECIAAAQSRIADNSNSDPSFDLLAQAQVQLGHYEDAATTLRQGIGKNPFSIRLRWRRLQLAPYVGEEERVDDYTTEIDALIRNSAWRYTQDPDDLVILAKFALQQGADPKQVQDIMLDRARKLDPNHRDSVLALADLALTKRDFALAADVLRPALETWPDDPDLLFALSQALENSSPQDATRLRQRTLRLNVKHIPARLTIAEQQIDGERYSDARHQLAQVLKINPHQPEALALLSVVHRLQGDEKQAETLREKALSHWSSNPAVDHRIGTILSHKYRFDAGAAAQRQALEFDPNYLPAKKQLAQDLLRLGDEDAGWKLADEAYQQDQYDVASYNLVTLRDEIEKFTTLSADGLHVRMAPDEAQLYGERVMALIHDAREILCEKYEVELTEPVLVEIFPKPSDFAVRTFGMPGVSGYLGVCFGDVITANSPASQQSNPVNWESVLWHEFAHVVTLNKTHNRMPRWLSEGISVYEERQQNPAWGEQMNFTYREMIEEGQLTPISKLSSAFLAPPSPRHLMFAYFESSLVVEYIINTYGLDSLLAILDDLGVGMTINEALARHTVPLPQLEDEFAEFVNIQVHLYGWYVDWSEFDLGPLLKDEMPAERLLRWAAEHPRNYRGLKSCGELLARLDRPQAALKTLQQAVLLFPDETGEESALFQLAALQRQTGDTAGERNSLQRLAAIDSSAAAALLRLIELDSASGNWKSVRDAAHQLLAINPLIPRPHRALANASRHLDTPGESVPALEALLAMNPADPASLHYQLADAQHALGHDEDARQHVLRALEAAPRYRDALALLLTLHKQPSTSSTPEPPAPATPAPDPQPSSEPSGTAQPNDPPDK